MVNLQRWEYTRNTDQHLVGSPEALVHALHVSENGAVAVIGGSPELFARPIASCVGTGGVVYSVDATEDRLPLADQSVDLALMGFVFRQIAHIEHLLTEIRRVLRPGGRIAVADWIRQEEQTGPLREERVSAATCERWLAAIGFGLLGQRLLNSSHYLILGRRPPTD